MNLGVYAHKLPQKAVGEGAPQISCYLEGRAPVLSVVTWWPVEQGMTIHCHSTCQLHIWEPFGTCDKFYQNKIYCNGYLLTCKQHMVKCIFYVCSWKGDH